MKKRLMALVLCLTVMMTMFAPLANATEEELLSTATPAPAAATVEPQAESAQESAAPTEAHTEQPSAQPEETVGQEATAEPEVTTEPEATAAAETPAAETPETPAPVITEPDAVYTYEFSNTTSDVIYGYEATATLGQSVSVPRNGRVVLSGPAGQWQILVGGVWADLAGADTGVALTYALLKNAGSSTRIRCLDAAGNSQGESAVTLTEAVSVAAPAQEPVLKKTPLRAAAPAADVNAGEGEQTTYNIVINYVFEDSKPAADSWRARIAKGSDYSASITSPTVVGYAPDQEVVNVDVKGIDKEITYTVTYKPALVNFTVKHFQQNASNDDYTLVETTTETGFTNDDVGKGLEKQYDGFTALLYNDTTKIAADGSTEVEIRYDRNYYLISLNLNGGYGVDPVYARYGAPINIGEPTKAGYNFAGWSPELPKNMPVGGGSYAAQWTAEQVDYTVQYWQENANDTDYSYFERVEKQAQAGSKVSGSGDKTYAGFTFDHADANVEVKGDGSTVVNVYYKRNVYEVRFYNNNGNKEDTSKRITAKYGAFIGDKWPGNGWYVNQYSTNTAQSYLAIMPLGGKNFYGQQTGNNTSTATYYVEVLPGENGTTTVGGKSYKVHHTDSAKHGYGGLQVTDEERYEIEGFTANTAVSTKNGSTYNGAKFYYTRNLYQLVFDDQYGTTVSENLPYEQVLSKSENYTNDYRPQYPETLEAGAYEFGGWYSDPGCTREVDWTAKMPAAKVVVYAKWVPVQHTVKTFLTKEEVTDGNYIDIWENVNHRATIKAPDDPKNEPYKFIGWFYEENGEEKAFDFEMPITRDMNLYAKWSSDVLVEYTIRYAVRNGEDLIYIADDTTGSALVKSTKTFEAKTGTALKEGYQTGYFPEVGSHSLTIEVDKAKNIYTFIYVKAPEVSYTVRYLDKATGEPVVVDGKSVPDKEETTSNAVITETFKQITGYAPDAYQKRLVLSANKEENVLIFWYTKDETHAPVQIIHWRQNIAGDGYTEYQSSTDLNGEIGKTYSEQPLTLDGFTYNADPANPVDGYPALASGELTAAGLVLNLYYDRNEYPFEFRFLEQGTEKKLAEPVTGSARYQAQVTQTAETIPGYTLVSAENQAINIAIEDPKDVAAKNVKTFYYVENTVMIHYRAVTFDGATLTQSTTGGNVSPADEQVKVLTGTPEGSVPTANENYRFVGWFTDAECTNQLTNPVGAVIWIHEGNKLIPLKPENGFVEVTYYAKFVKLVGNVTVEKMVTGNLGDQTKDFKFVATYTVNGELKNEEHYLKHDETWTLANIPVGTVVTITEDEYSGYTTSNDKGEGGRVATITVAEGENNVIFTNNKETVPDTGVLLDSLPYVVILAVVVLGAALVIVRRRKHRDDD